MPSLYLTTPGLQVHLESERLTLTPPAESANGSTPPPLTPPVVHLRDIERAFIHHRTAISLAALAELARRDIPVVILDHHGDILGFFQGPAPVRTARRAQYRRSDDPRFCLATASALVEAKILNQRRVLQRLAANREQLEITPHLLWLRQLAEQAVAASSLETLRGYEGTAAGRHFEVYATFFPPEVPFPGRSRRPPLNPPNAVLSYAYTLLAAECESLIHLHGLDPAIGCYHEAAENRPALALDLIEPFRAPVADALALDLFSHGTLQPSLHFESRNGGCYLNYDGKKRFFVAYERRMERDFSHQQSGRRTSLRHELENQVLAFRRAVLDDVMFEPFLMN